MRAGRVTKLWQRNTIGAVVSAAVITVGAVVYWQPEWQRYESTMRPAHTAAPRQPVTVDGQTWSLRNVSRSTTQTGSGAPLPEGTVRVNATVERSGPPEAGFGCFGYVTDGQRSWRFTAGQPCLAATSMQWNFLVPASVDLTALDVRTPDQAILIRFEL